MKIFSLLTILFLVSCNGGGGGDSAADKFLGSNFQDSEEDSNTYTGASSLTFNPLDYDFGYVSTVGAGESKTISLINRSSGNIYIQELDSVDDTNLILTSHTCPQSPEKFSAGASCDIVVTFTPASATSETLTLSVDFSESLAASTVYTVETQVTGEGVSPLVFGGINAINPAGVSTSRALLEWTGISDVDHYEVYLVTGGGSITTLIANVAGNATNYTATGLSPATAYTFRVNAFNAVDESDGNTTDESFTTDVLGSFGAITTIATPEGVTATSVSLDTLCTDIEANTADSILLTSQSDADVNCSLIGSPNRIQCTPNYKVGHAAWSATINVACYLNDYSTAYTQTLTVNVSDTNQAPTVTAINDQTVLYGTSMSTIDANSTTDVDADGDTLTYICRYDTAIDGNVAAGSDCDLLVNADTSNVSFDTVNGILDWTPGIAAAGGSFEFMITASDGSLTGNDVFVISVSSPPPSAAQTTITASAGTIASAGTVNLTVQSKDSGGSNLASGGATVTLATSGGTSTGTISAITDNGDGTYSATFTGVTAGTATTITGTINGSSITSVLPTITVTPGSVDIATSTMVAGTSALTAGSATPLTVTLMDSNSNIVPTGVPTVVMYKESGGSGGSISAVTANGDGTYSATFTATTSGSAATLRATIDGVAITSSLPNITVSPAALDYAQSTVIAQSASVPQGGSISITLTAKDAYGNTLTAGGLTGLAFSNSGGTSTGTFGSVIDNSNGTYRCDFTGVGLGSATTINVLHGATPFTNTMPTVTVEAADPDITNSVISVSVATVASGLSVTLTFDAKTALGADITYGGDTIIFSNTGGTSTGVIFPVTATDNSDGTYTALFNGVTAGTATSITATVNGVPFTGVMPTLTVQPGALAQVEAVSVPGTGLTTGPLDPAPIFRLKDANGNVLTTDNTSTLSLSLAPASAGGSLTGTSSMTVVNGVADFTGTNVGIDSAGVQYLRGTSGGFNDDSTAINVLVPTLTLTKTTTSDVIISYLNDSFVHPTRNTAEAEETNTATIATTNLTAQLTVTGTGLSETSSLGTNNADASITGYNILTNDLMYWLFTTSRNNSVSSTCNFVSPYAALTCTLSGNIFVTYDEIAAANMTTEGLIINDGYIDSNEIDVTKFEIVKVWDYNASGNDNPRWLQNFNSRLFFSSTGRTNGASLKVHSLYNDGSGNPIVNTHSRTRSSSDTSQDYSLYSVAASTGLYFSARSSGNRDKLFRLNSDLTIDQISDIRGSGNHDGFNGNMIEFNGRIYFTAYNTNNKRKLFVYNPGDGTIKLVADIRGNASQDDNPSYFAVANNTFYFVALNSSGRTKLYSINSAHDTLTQVSDQRGSGNNDNPYETFEFNGKVYTSIYQVGQNRNKVFRIEPGGLVLVSDIRNNNEQPRHFVEWNGYMYFRAYASNGRTKLFRMDTSENFQQVTDLVPGSHDQTFDMTVWDDYLVFRGYASNSTSEKVFLMDTSFNVYQISDFVPNGGDDEPRRFTVFDGDLYFTARENSSGHQVIYRLRKKTSI